MPAEALAGAGQDAAGLILGVGIATVDIVNLVAAYPAEDAEVRALVQRSVRGGNVANTLAVLRQLGRPCAWLGTIADDAGAALIRDDLRGRGVALEHAVTVPGAGTPTSHIALSRATGSRTIIHHRDLRELTAADFDAVPLDALAWLHFEGRNPPETARMIERVRRERPELPVSVEIEKPRDGLEVLLRGAGGGPGVLIFSRAYAAASARTDAGPPAPAAFLRRREQDCDADLLLLPWGADGAYGLARGGEPVHVPAHAPARVVDTLAAGDVFNALVIDGLLRGLALPALLARANRVAGFKCGRDGLDGLIDEIVSAGIPL